MSHAAHDPHAAGAVPRTGVEPELTYRFQAAPRHLESLRAIVQSFCESVPMISPDACGVVIAVSEGASNAIEHGYPGTWKGPVTVSCVVSRGEVEIRITDQGPGFDFRPQEQLDPREIVAAGKRRGLGLFLIRRWSDSTEYVRGELDNTLVVRRRLGRDGPGLATKPRLPPTGPGEPSVHWSSFHAGTAS